MTKKEIFLDKLKIFFKFAWIKRFFFLKNAIQKPGFTTPDFKPDWRRCPEKCRGEPPRCNSWIIKERKYSQNQVSLSVVSRRQRQAEA